MTPLFHWLTFHLALVALLAAEYALHLAVPNTRRKAIYAIALWTTASLALAAVLVPHYHALGAQQYLASYALEQSLSIDNLFVFLLLFRLFGIPAARQPKVLFWGVTGAILMRGAFIAGGLTLLHRFAWISYVFAAVLLIAAVRLVLPHNETNSTPRWISWLTRIQPVSDDHNHFIVLENGQRRMTILFLALLAVELTDVVFALDSIPAVLSITRVPFLAYTSNIMAVMCLRSLYVLLAEALSRLRYLHFGLAAVLAFAALKMLLANVLDISPLLSLAIIAALLTAPITASLITKPSTATSALKHFPPATRYPLTKMSLTTIPVRTASASYDVTLGAGLLPTIGERLTQLAGSHRAFIITSPEIQRLHGASLLSGLPADTPILHIPAGEQHKRLTTLESLADQLTHLGADRDSLLLALGGGVIGDITGFLAAIYMRGIRYIGIPTTALAQIDSSLGGKTGVNLATGKNLIGAFHHPLAVFADIDTLSTLPANELRAGLQEAIKAGIIRDRDLFDFMDTHSAAALSGDTAALTHVIAAAVRVKAAVVSADEKESGERMLLNLGHTLGHAIESATHYTQLLHGEAVAWGMLAAAAIAKRRGLMTVAEHDQMERVIITYGPLKRFQADAAQLVALTANDKKNRSGTRSFILPRSIGDAVVVKDVTTEELMFTAERMMAMVARQGVT